LATDEDSETMLSDSHFLVLSCCDGCDSDIVITLPERSEASATYCGPVYDKDHKDEAAFSAWTRKAVRNKRGLDGFPAVLEM
jgi:hypothetical protein